MRRSQNYLILVLLSFMLISCGGDSEDAANLTASSGGGVSVSGGGAGGSTPDDTSATTSIYVSLAIESEIPFTINTDQPGKLVATVTGTSAPVVVTFSSEVALLPITAAVTVNGIASVDIIAGSELGAGVVTATLSNGESSTVTVIVGALNLRMGSGTPFVEQAQLSIAQISSGGTASVSVDIVDEQGNLYLQPVEVNFTSTCASTPVPTAQLSSPVSTNKGQATSTYTAQGCVNDDVITVTANVGGLDLAAKATINILSTANSIQFLSADPKFIGIVGTGAVGGSENSTLKFKVVNSDNFPVSNVEVVFSLNTDIGGLTLSQESAISDAQGIVKTSVHGGSVATTVRVTAQIAGTLPLIATQSSSLIVSSGIPDQDSFSLSFVTFNPEAGEYDGIEVPVIIRLSDAFNNPVPDGTAVVFRTEGGQIESGCVTLDGGCTVMWTSQEPRPSDGRSTVTATALGEESFPDTNGNGRFDEVDAALFIAANYDMTADTFEDFNEDGIFNPLQAGGAPGGEFERLIDFDFEGFYNFNYDFDLEDGKYNGILCGLALDGVSLNPFCADGFTAPKSAMIRANGVIVMSGSTAVITVLATNDSTVLGVSDPNDNKVVIDGDGLGSVKVYISDVNDQQMPSGTTVDFAVSVGTLATNGHFVWPSSNAPGGQLYTVGISGAVLPDDDTGARIGFISITVTTPQGVTTEKLLTIEIL